MKLNFPWQKIQLIRAAQEFAALKLWDTFDNLDFFVIETPLEGPVVACIMGAGMQEYGLCAFREPDAFEQPFLLSEGQEALLNKGNTVGFSMEYYRQMSPDIKKWYKKCNFRAKKDDWLPEFLLVRHGTVDYPENSRDINLLLYILKGITAAHDRGQFDPRTADSTGPTLLTILTSGNAEKPTIEVTRKTFDGSAQLLVYCTQNAMFEELDPGEEFQAVPLKAPDVDLSVIPEADDLKGWKAVSAAVTNRFINFWNQSDHLRKNRPSRQFFGDTDWDYYLAEYEKLMALPGYVTWAALCYRPRKKDPTYMEKLLAGDLPSALRVLLEAMNQSYPSLYQIERTDPKAGTLVVKDLLLGGTVMVHDYGFSETSRAGWIVPFRITPAGSFHFIDIAGPVFGAMEAVDILMELRALKLPVKPTAEWLRENAYVFGRLWSYFDETQEFGEQGPDLVNTDGDELEFITAQFGYSDPQTVRRALKRHPAIDYDEMDDAFIWFKEAGGPGGNTVLGRIFFEDGFIKAEVNSQKRFTTLRGLLEDIGLIYRSHEGRSAEDMLDEKKMSQAEPEGDLPEEDLPEDVKAAVREQFDAFYMDWLDQPVPALDNKTPRQAAKTAKGAQKVKLLIETIPHPFGNMGAEAPKKEMLKALGLEDL